MNHKTHIVTDLTELLTLISSDTKPWFVAGGTDISLNISRNQLPKNSDIYFISGIKCLKSITKSNGYIKIGALSSITDILESSIINESLPFLREALKDFASAQIRNVATLTGNIANGSPTADTIPILLVLEAELLLSSNKGSRVVSLSDFFTDYKTNVLENNEVITEILIPDKNKNSELFSYKVGNRSALTIAKVNIAILKGEVVKIAAGSVNSYPIRLFSLEKLIIEKGIERLTTQDIENELANLITPITDFRSTSEYRYTVTRNLICSTLDSIKQNS